MGKFCFYLVVENVFQNMTHNLGNIKDKLSYLTTETFKILLHGKNTKTKHQSKVR